MRKIINKRLIYYITNIKSLFYKDVCLFREKMSQNPLFTSKLDYHNLLEIFKQAVREAKKKSKIMAISNKYKDTFDNFINSLDKKFLDQLEAINKRLYNTLKFENSLISFSKRDCYLNSEDILNTLLELAPKTQNF